MKRNCYQWKRLCLFLEFDSDALECSACLAHSFIIKEIIKLIVASYGKGKKCISVLYRMINSNIAIGYSNGVLELYDNTMKNSFLTITLFYNEIIDIYQDKENIDKLMVSNRITAL